jgi:hypothetical protein
MFFLTLPATVGTSERASPKLKLSKNYLRSTTIEERLSGLGISSIENERGYKLNVKNIAYTFAELKAREAET